MGGVLLSAVAVIIYLFLYHTALFSTLLINLANNQILSSKKLSINGDITGSLLGPSFGMRSILLMNVAQDDTIATAKRLNLTGWEWNWDVKEFSQPFAMLEQSCVYYS